MKQYYLLALATIVLAGCGDGAFSRLTTVSGVYTVKNPDGYPVVCFIEAGGGGIHCIPTKDLQ